MLSSLPCHLPARSVQAGLPAAGGNSRRGLFAFEEELDFSLRSK